MFCAIECSPSFASVSPLSCPLSLVAGLRRTWPCTLTLTFPVTTAYITHTCSTVQPPHTRVMALFPSLQRLRSLSAYLSIAPQPFLSLHYRFTFPLPRFIICSLPQCAFLVCRLLPWLDFASVIISVFCITAGSSFFLILSLLVWIAAEAIEGKDGPGPVKWCIYNIFFYLTILTCALCGKGLSLHKHYFPLFPV